MNHVSFLRISNSFFSLSSPDGDAGTRWDSLAGIVKRQCAVLQRFLALPSNAVFCRCPTRRLQSGSRDSRQPRTNQENTMGEPFSGTAPSARPPEDRLDSWKEIAAYLNRDVTTVQRWEKREGMPVHRHLHDRIGSVYASRAELDTWARSRNPPALENGEATPTPAPPACGGTWYGIFASLARRPFVLALAVTALLAIGVVLWLQRRDYFWRNPIADARFQTVTDF